jgi:capsular polysaccharide transport system permease protein
MDGATMSAQESARGRAAGGFTKHTRIIWALMLRELSTRYGRENIGFLWIIAEPICFAVGISAMWNFEKPQWEHNIGVTAFVLTGYLGLVLHRQTIGHGVGAVTANKDLFYHRQLTPLHMCIARSLTEFVGVTLAGCVVAVGAMTFGLLPPLQDYQDLGLVLAGWTLIWAQAAAVALILAGLAEMFDVVERVAHIANYLTIPLTGAFYLISWMPLQVRPLLLSLPFIHGWEILRKGFFGTNIDAQWNLSVAFTWLFCEVFLGLLILGYARDKVEIE